MTFFSDKEYERYTRHIQLPQVGAAGQRRLKESHVVIVGCGGLGAPVSLYLAAAGVGKLTLVDGDTVDLTNLQRQITFAESQIGQAKASSTRERLLQINSDIAVEAVDKHLSPDNAHQLLELADLVLDCSDNFAARYLVNDTCKILGKPWIYASVFQFSGQCALFRPESSCFRCLFAEPPAEAVDCNAAGVLGVLPGMLGTLQAAEAIKVLLDIPSAIDGKLLMLESDDLSMHAIKISQRDNCPACAKDFAFDRNDQHYQTVCETGEQTGAEHSIEASEFHRYAARDDVVVIDVRSEQERQAFHLGGEHIPLAELETEESLPVEKILLLYCQTGIRSTTGCEMLSAKGYTALSVNGGIAQVLKQTSHSGSA